MNQPTLKTAYQEQIVPELTKSRGYKNLLEVPKLEKIVLNSGVGTSKDKNVLNDVAKDFALITGQKPIITYARKSISNFKLREGMPVGVKITLRGNQMWEFMYRLITVALPLIRDFRGISPKLDGRGNYSLGIADHTIFPEINVDTHKYTIGLDACIVTTAKTDEEGIELLTLLGMPFRRRLAAA
ncbi:MAG: 50S ribosomal protein L5 [Opitutaceae bacterium]|nr:50S ribosomal protein L5 [Opitutaceae bacterium]|tara:strand:- start:5554 stop:6108 length:555 start_codon:yes stop_codon:yes gene_type:complete